jgi:uncharacterized damage-inducible protein DinB
MDVKMLILGENDRVRSQLLLICSDLADEQVVYEHDAVDERGIGNIVSHIYSGLGNRARQVNGEPRQDPPEPPRTNRELLAFIDGAHARTASLIERVTPAQLDAQIEFRNQQIAGASIMMDAFAHAFRHVGNILDARHLGGFETRALG